MKSIFVFYAAIAAFLLTACSLSEPAGENDPLPTPLFLPDLGPAPELHNEVWLNTDRPLRLSELRGKVVLLEMWTFG